MTDAKSASFLSPPTLPNVSPVDTFVAANTERPVVPTFVVYGEYGVGKTRLGASRRQGKKTLFLNAEEGLASIAGLPHIEVIDIHPRAHPIREMTERLQAARIYESPTFHFLQRVAQWLRDRADEYDLVVFDTVSALAQYLNAEANAIAIIRREPAKDPLKISQDDYGHQVEMMRRIVWEFLAIPVPVLYLFAERVDRSGRIVPSVNEGTLAVFGQYSSVIGRLVRAPLAMTKDGRDVEVVVPWLHTDSDGTFLAKDRIGLFGGQPLPVPTMDKIFARLNQRRQKEA